MRKVSPEPLRVLGISHSWKGALEPVPQANEAGLGSLARSGRRDSATLGADGAVLQHVWQSPGFETAVVCVSKA